ncbi:transmembrane protein 74 [Corythoichthys intestinalis]|uniref:transmembrane protein 74 n=1 Tax=Corythoichthys intestinalis TaxID=161448 RepID=UPI0025A68AD7|nr:transmembrane protein 74 [Corythoichthys intestinalis]XP_061788971.1 transmembrane protein 74-like [Nerophis lumbriciformis]
MASPVLSLKRDGDKLPHSPAVLERLAAVLHVRKQSESTGGGSLGDGGCNPARSCHDRCHSATRRAEVKLRTLGEEKVRVCCDEELETSFTYIDENVNLAIGSPDTSCKSSQRNARNCEPCSETAPEFSFMSEDDLSFGEASGSSVDYWFISAVTFLVTGISLVIISYAVPRDVVVDKDSVSAREMEKLELESARIGGHLDRCVIAGLCLLTLGGVVLSTLLMISMWKGEMYRRKVIAYSKRSAKLYGSISLKTKSSPSHSSAHLSLEDIVESLN